MNLINEEITHKVFGKGNIVDHEGTTITVDFNTDIKKFVYPDAFRSFITLNDQNVANSLKKIILKRELEEAALEKEREEERERQLLEQQRKEAVKNFKIHESSQIVVWIDEDEQQQVFSDWQVSTGEIQSGKNKGQINRAVRLRPNSACLITERDANQQETDRRISGIFMVNEMYSGELNEDGVVSPHADFKIQLTEQEASKMLFWNYYVNKNYPHRMTWNSGKYRYYDNIWTAQILKDIIALKTDEEEINAANNFLAYFCQMNFIDVNNIPEVEGALKQ